MKTFKDSTGREWKIAINVATLKRVRDAGKNFGDLPNLPTLMEQIGNDPTILAEVLWLLCQPQADAAKVSRDDFEGSLGGDSLGAAYDAFTQELTDFFPHAPTRAWIKEILSAMAQGREAAVKFTRTQMAKALAQVQEETSGEPSIESPASSASIPTPSPSAS